MHIWGLQKKKIIEAVFSGWCDRDYGDKGKELPEVGQVITGIGEHFNASGTFKRESFSAVKKWVDGSFMQSSILCTPNR